MIIEQRTYTVHPGKVPEYLALYEKEGLSVQTRHLPKMLGYFYTEIGDLNQIIHMWGYETLDHRTECRAKLVADPDWQALLNKLFTMLVKMETKILIPSNFSPIR